MTTNEPTVRYWRDPGSGITYPAADDTISGFYRDSRWTEVAVLTESGLAAHTTAARADALREFADSLGVDANEDHDGEWWSGYRQAQREAIHNANNYVARTPDPNGDNT